jgi:hypothetical protein
VTPATKTSSYLEAIPQLLNGFVLTAFADGNLASGLCYQLVQQFYASGFTNRAGASAMGREVYDTLASELLRHLHTSFHKIQSILLIAKLKTLEFQRV